MSSYFDDVYTVYQYNVKCLHYAFAWELPIIITVLCTLYCTHWTVDTVHNCAHEFVCTCTLYSTRCGLERTLDNYMTASTVECSQVKTNQCKVQTESRVASACSLTLFGLRCSDSGEERFDIYNRHVGRVRQHPPARRVPFEQHLLARACAALLEAKIGPRRIEELLLVRKRCGAVAQRCHNVKSTLQAGRSWVGNRAANYR